MNIDVNKVIILDDLKEYVIASKVEYNGSSYIYILEVGNHNNYKFAEIEDDGIGISVIEPEEVELINNLIPLFGLNAKKILDEMK